LEEGSQDAWLVDVAQALRWPPLMQSSLKNLFPAVNCFLTLSESLGLEEFEHSRLLGIKHNDNHRQLIKALEGSIDMPTREVAKMRQNSLLGGVAKFAPKGIKRPRRLAARGGTKQSDQQKLDFPLEYVNALVDAATSWRDKALWLLLAASGIRTSEARNLLLDDVDFVRQQIYVLDPNGRRFAPTQRLAEDSRFKGRAIALTYLFPPLRGQFFEALQKYLECEYIPVEAAGQPRYLFQYMEPKRRGQSLVNASDNALIKSFKLAAAKANVPLPISGKCWGLHSLRHLYGVYMLNDYPIDAHRGIFGLQLVEVQMLMGHTSIVNTKHYARSKPNRLMAKLQASDEAMLSLSHEEARLLPCPITQRLEMRP
jgi:integrase